MLFLDILAEFLTEDLLYNKVKDYLEIRKGELKDSAFEKFYQTFVVDFILREWSLFSPSRPFAVAFCTEFFLLRQSPIVDFRLR